jgi:hypothetical protein
VANFGSTTSKPMARLSLLARFRRTRSRDQSNAPPDPLTIDNSRPVSQPGGFAFAAERKLRATLIMGPWVAFERDRLLERKPPPHASGGFSFQHNPFSACCSIGFVMRYQSCVLCMDAPT